MHSLPRSSLTGLSSDLNVVEVLPFSSANSIIFLSSIVHIEEFLDPLKEFKVIKSPCFDEFLDINMSLDSVLVKGGLEYLVVVYEFKFMFSSPSYL